MAIPASQKCVFSGQLEGNRTVIEIVPVRVKPVMAGQAIIPVCQEMRRHEIRLDLLVTCGADSLVKFGIALDMTGIANKRRTIRLELVGG